MGDDGAVTEVSPGAVLAEISDAPLSVDVALAAVRHPRAGAVALFVGTVRDHDGGADGVHRLDYSSHPDAAAVLTDLVGRVAGRPEVLGAAAVHRVGALAVGDPAVVCAVSAAHRAAAFEGCRDLIEELKATVPIWKKQWFEDGATEWVGL